MTHTTFKTICSKTFKTVEIAVSKTKVLDAPAHLGVQTKLGGICPACHEMHTTTVTDDSANKYAPVYPAAAAQQRMTRPDLADVTDPQRDGAL